jgi:hypothetical protein
MLRTFNYTGRQRIHQNEASFHVESSPGASPSFSAAINLVKKNYPEDASIYIDVWYKETRQRFFFGTVAHVTPPDSTSLDSVELTESIQFRVMVVDEKGKHALLLGEGTFRIAGEDPDEQDRKSLVSVLARDLGPLPWKVEFDEETRPMLCINRNIPNPIEKMRSDPVFQALVLPAAMREIFPRVIFSDDVDPDSEVYRQWTAFALTFTDQSPDDLDGEAQQDWIDDVVHEFCVNFDLVDRLINVFKEED